VKVAETGTEIVVLDGPSEIAREAARRLVAALDGAIAERGEAHVALTGGSSALELYRELVKPEWRDGVAWQQVHLWWGDERFVPVDHPDSNIGLAYRMLLALAARAGESGVGAQGVDVNVGDVPALPIRVENVHPFEVDETLSESNPGDLVAERYAEEMASTLPRGRGGLPAFDVVLLGVGEDGHILSVFPDSEVLATDAPLVAFVTAPQHIGPHHPRITLNPRLIKVAEAVIVMVSGEDKAEVVGHVLGDRRDPRRWPAQLAVRGNAVWLLDQAAAAQLDVAAEA
jgi:6-phosphogluconolactonase